MTDKSILEENNLLKGRIADLENQLWTFCPECGCAKVNYCENEHNQCANCHQEWFSDIDYTDTVIANLNRIADLEAQLDAANYYLRLIGQGVDVPKKYKEMEAQLEAVRGAMKTQSVTFRDGQIMIDLKYLNKALEQKEGE